MIQQGVSVDAADEQGYTALDYAVQSQQMETVQILLKLGANVNHVDAGVGGTPLTYTVARFGGRGHSRESAPVRNQIARLLLDKGANPNRATESGMTPLHLAVIDKNAALIRMLIKSGANRDARTKDSSYTPLDLATPELSPGEDVIRALKE